VGNVEIPLFSGLFLCLGFCRIQHKNAVFCTTMLQKMLQIGTVADERGNSRAGFVFCHAVSVHLSHNVWCFPAASGKNVGLYDAF
jgi:hypothetical protein